MKERLDRH